MKKWLFVLLIFSACHKKQPHSVIPSYPVRTDVAIVKEAPIFIEALGHVDSITAINIKSRIEGELTGVYFTQGQEVKKMIYCLQLIQDPIKLPSRKLKLLSIKI